MSVLLILLLTAGSVARNCCPKSTQYGLDLQLNRISNNSLAATCRDGDLARFMNNAMATHIHDMDALSKSILNQIILSGKKGSWIVHAEIISGRSQGRDWQTTTNGDLFSGRSMTGCFYHDMQTYILVAKLY
ncbi:hypothetical protein KIN20_023679 [Parelaphostrongylus tenuis]|uniref:Uncharacterized protein n=1 Tax=Parelaphostrongylus tenuis TaxID=148309 RepID=A0AAD5MS41_PARTN|nr:hypothetical protein KIN20_023679 [Parelaphostrongylus tenuis]